MDLFKKHIDIFNQAYSQVMASHHHLIKKTVIGIKLCNASLYQLNQLLMAYEFNNTQEEIYFFKYIKTVPMSVLIYLTDMQRFEIQKPKVGYNLTCNHIDNELTKINEFLSTYNHFFHYMEQKQTHFDKVFFTRKYRNHNTLTPFTNYYQCKSFASAYDMLWAKIKANLMLTEHLNTTLKQHQLQNHTHATHNGVKLQWTGSKTDLTELIYALFAANTLNNGKADINIITAVFEDLFQIKLGNFYKTYSEIKARKTSQTKFLEELILRLQQKMAHEDQI